MIRRLFNLLFGLCGAWVMVLAWNWQLVTDTEGVGPILVIAILPFIAVLIAQYLIGRYIDLF